MKTDNETELKHDFSGKYGQAFKAILDKSKELGIVKRFSLHHLNELSKAVIETRPEPTLKSSEGLVEKVINEINQITKSTTRFLKDRDNPNGIVYGIMGYELEKIKSILSTIAPTPETASEGEKWISVEEVIDIDNGWYYGSSDKWNNPMPIKYSFIYEFWVDVDDVAVWPDFIMKFRPIPPTQDNSGVV